ncbi:hypothetical protein PR202_ga06666 [Eleusine coracana subsp. coracana]|uniref:NAD-dependent epimerase/dehydratase domain-containing protein n=1 Tax=Eleusine coracana subsp. coracana TaxID=191504 RepID=A0AAV5BVG6_ELECO|nr:hypothetical protein PR202_ga06666 [Eleusine coracana subsp. coracana]
MAKVVCVTGAGGFIGSWIVKLLLARGYALTHSLVSVWQEEIIEPIIAGTRNVVEAAADAGVRRLVLSSTIGTMYMNPHRDPDAPLDDSSWSDLDYCKRTKNWCCYAKTIAERGAWEAARARGLDLAVVIPVVTLGELLQSGMNTSTLHILKYLTGEAKAYVNESHAYVHVKDAAEAHVRVLLEPGAGGRRYVCAERTLHRGELCRILAQLFPEYPIPTRCKDEINPPKKGYKFTNQPLKDLGIKFTPVHEYLYEAVKSLQDKGFLKKVAGAKVKKNKNTTI